MKNKGFSLVELIVVIAIMAILVGVAVPVYTSYIDKANKSKDIQLVDEVAHALQVYAAGNHETVADDYVVLTTDGASAADGGFVDAALTATFGSNWREELVLSYGEWTDNGVLAQVLADAEGARNVANSSFMQNSTPADMMATVSNVTGALGSMAVTASADPLVTMRGLELISEEQATNIREELDELELSWVRGEDNTAYGNALSNILVKELSQEAGVLGDEHEPSTLFAFASVYASVYGWASTSEEGATALEDLNAKILDENATAATIMGAFAEFEEEYYIPGSEFAMYYDGSKGESDLAAFVTIMNAVGDLSEKYDMTEAGVFASEKVAEQLNDYVNVVTAVASMSDAQLSALGSLEAGSVVVFVNDKGAVSVLPASVLEKN